MDVLQSIFRWAHIVAGIIWIGHLYFFNFVNGPFQATIDAEAKKKVNPELLPRALYWFRWGAAWTWATGVVLLLLVFYHGRAMYETAEGWPLGALLMIAVTFLAFFLYDALAKQGFAKDPKTFAAVGFLLIVVYELLFTNVPGVSYRGWVIHTGAMFGTIMAANVWFRIWPAQQKIISAVKAGTPPDAALVALAGTRSRHNTYLSVPLVWTMIDQHTTVPFAGTWLGLSSWIWLAIFVAIGWWFVTMFYRQAAKVKGF